MARPCTVCASADVRAVDEAIVTGTPVRQIAQRYNLGEHAIARHRDGHLSPALVAAEAERGHDHVQTLVDRIEALIGHAEDILQQAKVTGSAAQALGAIRELRGLLELFGRASGELQPDGPRITVNVLSTVEWLAARQAVVEALAPFPEARAAVGRRLIELEAPA